MPAQANEALELRACTACAKAEPSTPLPTIDLSRFVFTASDTARSLAGMIGICHRARSVSKSIPSSEPDLRMI